MAQIARFGPLRHLRAEPNQFILHYKGGRVVRSGAGVAYFFNPLSAAVAQVPVEDCETTFLLNERSSDFQEVAVQCTLAYRVVDHARAAARLNFSISLVTGAWLERPLERLAALWSQKSLEPVRRFVAGAPVVEVVQRAEHIRAALDDALRADPELGAIGLELVTVQVSRVAPTAELEKALQTPTREGIQQKADEAIFARRALAVEKERAIKENELATELELAKRQIQLIDQKGKNQLREIEQVAASERARVEAELARQALVAEAETERQRILAEGEARRQLLLTQGETERQRLLALAHARDVLQRAGGDTDARKLWDALEQDREARRVELWKETPQRVATAFAVQTAASKLEKVNHLNVTPDLLRTLLQEIATEKG